MFPASSHCKRRRFIDQGKIVLWPVHFRGYFDEDQILSGRADLEWNPAHERGDEHRWVHGVPSSVECSAVCLLHSSGREWVYCGVSTVLDCISVINKCFLSSECLNIAVRQLCWEFLVYTNKKLFLCVMFWWVQLQQCCSNEGLSGWTKWMWS